MSASDFENLIKVTTSTTGSGASMVLDSAVTGFRGAGANLTDGWTYSYAIKGAAGLYEIGKGVASSSGTVLSRVVSESSNANARVTLAGGEEVIVGTVLADDLPKFGATTVAFTGESAKEVTLTSINVTTTSQIWASIAGAPVTGDPDELELNPLKVYGRCTVNGTLKLLVVGDGSPIYNTYTINYMIL